VTIQPPRARLETTGAIGNRALAQAAMLAAATVECRIASGGMGAPRRPDEGYEIDKWRPVGHAIATGARSASARSRRNPAPHPRVVTP